MNANRSAGAVAARSRHAPATGGPYQTSGQDQIGRQKEPAHQGASDEPPSSKHETVCYQWLFVQPNLFSKNEAPLYLFLIRY